MATISLTAINPGDDVNAEPLDNNFNTIKNLVNGNIDNDNIKSAAAIAWSKISKSGSNIADIGSSLQEATDGATVTFDLSDSNLHTVTLGGNRTLALSNVSIGDKFIIRLKQDGTGSRTVTWFSGISWAGGSAPTLTTTADKTDVFGFICTDTDTYDGFTVGQNV